MYKEKKKQTHRIKMFKQLYSDIILLFFFAFLCLAFAIVAMLLTK